MITLKRAFTFRTTAQKIGGLIGASVLLVFALYVMPLQGVYNAPWLDEYQVNLGSITIEDCKPATCPLKLTEESWRAVLAADYGDALNLWATDGSAYRVLLYPVRVKSPRNPYPEINAECRKYDANSEAFGGCAIVGKRLSLAIYVAGSRRSIEHEIEGHVINNWVHQ